MVYAETLLMVWVKVVGMRPVFVCNECGFGYKDAKTALKCEQYCKEHKACSQEITKKAVHRPEKP